jgi:hypothetical protein
LERQELFDVSFENCSNDIVSEERFSLPGARRFPHLEASGFWLSSRKKQTFRPLVNREGSGTSTLNLDQ